MSDKKPLVFPTLISLNDYNGDFKSYFDAVYQIFKNDFIINPPFFKGVKVTAQAHPEVDGIHRTFYHITHEGEVENDREPDLRRMERIRFPKYIIQSSPHDDLLIWKNTRGKDVRILIFNDAENYLTVLTERKNYCLFWTAYIIEQSHQKRKLIKEYESYKKAETAQ